MKDIVIESIERHIAVVEAVRESMRADIAAAGQILTDCLKSGGKLLLCGNGGSAADAQHIAAEMTGRYILDRKPLPAVALTTDTSALTAIGNDFGFDAVFERQTRALAQPGDVLIGISTSGNSDNVIHAFEAARKLGCKTIALTGNDGGRMAGTVDRCLIVPSTDTPHIQEMHIFIGHILCDIVDRYFADQKA